MLIDFVLFPNQWIRNKISHLNVIFIKSLPFPQSMNEVKISHLNVRFIKVIQICQSHFHILWIRNLNLTHYCKFFQINSICFCNLNNIWTRQKRISHLNAKIQKDFSTQLILATQWWTSHPIRIIRDEKLVSFWLILKLGLLRTFIDLIQLG